MPMLVICGVLIWQLTDTQRDEAKDSLAATAKAVSIALDRQLTGYVQVLRSVAETTPFRDGDMAQFHALASRVAAINGALFVSLFDEDGRQLLNTALPFGSPLPQPALRPGPPSRDVRLADTDSIREPLRTKAPAYSRLFRSLSTGRLIFTVNIPVERDGRSFVLNAGFPADAVRQMLREHEEFSRTPVGIVDGKGIVVARTNDLLATGTRAPVVPEGSNLAKRGTVSFRTERNEEREAAYERSGVSEWTAVVAIDRAAEVSAMRKVLLGGAALVLAGALFALFFAGSIARRLRQEVADLVPVAGGAPPRGPEIRELADVERALSELASARRNEAAERERRLLADARKAQAEEDNRRKDEFLAMLSHELRNPLAALTSASHVLNAVDPSREEAATARAIVERQTRHMTRLVGDLLELSRVTLGKLELQRSSLDMADAVSAVVGVWRASGRLDLHDVSLAAEPAWIAGDRERIEQVVANLLDNALKFTPRGGKVRISIGREGEDAVLQVADDGAGLSEDECKRVFELFFQSDSAERHGSSLGIGLALVKRLAELHGGCVSVASEGRGRGAVFTLRLPALEAPQSVANARLAKGNSARSILIVEDNDDARQMLATSLASRGHAVRTAPDGHSGLALASEAPPHIAFIDLDLPDIDGYEVARRIRSEPALRAVSLVALTGHGQAEDQRRARAAGFDVHLLKPVGIERLEEVIAAARPGNNPGLAA